jgi:hypothetical protein
VKMDRDSITRTGARGPWGRAEDRSHGGAPKHIAPDTEQGIAMVAEEHEGRRQTDVIGKASSDSPALKPYRGKPAVRNFRGGDGNVGIIRSPVRAIALPDYRKGSSESILTSSLARDIARCFLKRRQRHRWAGLLSCKKPVDQDADSIPSRRKAIRQPRHREWLLGPA